MMNYIDGDALLSRPDNIELLYLCIIEMVRCMATFNEWRFAESVCDENTFLSTK